MEILVSFSNILLRALTQKNTSLANGRTDKTGRSTQKSLPKVCANFALREETLMEKNPPGANGEPGPFKQTQK